MKQRARSLGTAVLAALALTGCAPAAAVPTVPAGPVEQLPGTVGRPAVEVLAELPVKGRAPKTGYDREDFGPAWADVDRNGCDTRNDVLARDLVEKTVKPGTRGCVVLSGTLADPYTGQTITFQRGNGSSIDIDHVVALGNAWQTGALRWDEARRTAFANDPLNLLAVDYSANRQKGDGDAATWLPGDRGHRCGYVARQVAVKASYGLWLTPAEHDAIARVLDSCPGEPVPSPSAPSPSTPAPSTPELSTPAPRPPADVPAGTPELPYANCAAARAAGAAPLHRGEPGWSDSMDGDRDGVACE